MLPLLPSQYTCITQIAGRFLATHVLDEKIIFLSEYTESDLNVATIAAVSFALTRKIPYVPTIMIIPQMIVTIIQQDDLWYPALSNFHHFLTVTTICGRSLGCSRQDALGIANQFARLHGTVCIPPH